MESLLESLISAPLAVLSAQDLEDLLSQGEVLQEVGTQLRDMIRIVDWQGTLLVQEKTNKEEYIIRKMASREQAGQFIQQRLGAYERMWDG